MTTLTSDYKETNLIVQSNELVQHTNWEMNFIPMKLFKGIVSCINTSDPPKDNRVVIEKQDMYKIVGIDKSKSNYTYLRRQMESLMQHIIYIQKKDKIVQIPLVSKVIWDVNKDVVECFFDDEIMPYLIQMQGKYLQYPVTNLTGFSSKYGLIIYENLLSRVKQYKTSTHILDIDEIRHITGTKDKYKKTFDFENRVLNTAVDDINHANVEFLVKYKTVKRGKSIRSVEFIIRPRTSCLEDDYSIIMNPSLLESTKLDLSASAKYGKTETENEEKQFNILRMINMQNVGY